MSRRNLYVLGGLLLVIVAAGYYFLLLKPVTRGDRDRSGGDHH